MQLLDRVCREMAIKVKVCCYLVVIAMSCVVFNAHSQTVSPGPHQTIQETTDNVLLLLKTGIDPVTQSDEFIEKLSALLDPVVAFDYIAKGVMGVYAEGASDDQIKQFAESFKKGLVNTYGQGIANFQDLEVVVLPADEPIGDRRRAQVIQEVRSASGITKISYSMAKNRQGQWKMLNLILSGINFGQTFRGQFAAAVERNQGDVEKTIQEWEKGVQ